MNEIVRLRRISGADHKIEDRNNGYRHERAITGLVRRYGRLHEAEMAPRSYGGSSSACGRPARKRCASARLAASNSGGS